MHWPWVMQITYKCILCTDKRNQFRCGHMHYPRCIQPMLSNSSASGASRLERSLKQLNHVALPMYAFSPHGVKLKHACLTTGYHDCSGPSIVNSNSTSHHHTLTE